MKSSFWKFCGVIAFIPSLAWSSGLDIGRQVDRLDQLVHLAAAQKSQAAAVFEAENQALQAFGTVEERMERGIPIREQARAEIRRLLTTGQQEIYDRAPQRLGGGAMIDAAAKLDRIDRVVELSDEQLAQVAIISQRETDALLALPVSERSVQGAELHQEAMAQVRALLTSDQQLKLAANPNLITDLAERAYVTSFIKTSPVIVARLGVIARVSLAGSTTFSSDREAKSMKGSYSYNVRGSSGGELLKVCWERELSSGQIKVIKIENATGVVLSP